MKIALLIAILGFQANAFGPLPNGSYAGEMTCTSIKNTYNSKNVATIIVDDSSIAQDGDKTVFTTDANGFFTAAAGSKDTGSGYVTANGVHYKIKRTVNGLLIPGEDTFVFADKNLTLVSSATIEGEITKCEGTFAPAVSARQPMNCVNPGGSCNGSVPCCDSNVNACFQGRCQPFGR